MPTKTYYRKRKINRYRKGVKSRRAAYEAARRSRKNVRSRNRPQVGLVAFPSNRVVRMRYVDSLSHTVANIPGSNQRYIFRANSIFDPDYTGTGHQPMGHDQWNQFYDDYIVIGAKMKVTIIPYEAATTDLAAMSATLALREDTTFSSLTCAEVEERGGTAFRRFQSTANQKPIVMYCHFSPRKFFGIKDISDNASNLGAGFGNNPNVGAYFQFQMVNETGSTNSLQFQVVYRIDYIVKLLQPNKLVGS